MARVIETYTPIHADRKGDVVAVAEFYEKPDEVDKAVGVAQRQSWLILSLTMLGIYLCLFLVVQRGSRTIAEQRKSLRAKISQLMLVNEKNSALQERVISAAERSTSFNENFLQRLLQTIHDGPGQDLGFALMQIKNMSDSLTSGQKMKDEDMSNILQQSRLAVQSALADLRAISADLELPDLNQLLPSMVVARVLRDFQGKTGVAIPFTNNAKDVDTSFRVKVALYRILQESMANAFRHAQCKGSRVELTGDFKYLTLEISDSGPGFDPEAASKKGRLGLRGMRQRVEMLGGSFEVSSVVGAGTVTTMTLPLIGIEEDSE
jgi:signal transduction histidine kinase